MTDDVKAWQRLMDHLVEEALMLADPETADYTPGTMFAPGAGTEGDAPDGIEYEDLGPLALVCNEAIDSACVRGADRDSLLEQISQAAGDDFDVDDVKAILSGELLCPEFSLLQALATSVSVDMEILVDAAQRGGCKNYSEQPTVPPGY